MTVTYSGKVANAKLCAFSRMLFYWKGSVYKLMYKEMIIYITLYATASIIYRFALKDWQKRIFELVVLHCEKFGNLIPLSFVLGFYVAIVVTRWWNQYLSIPWPDRVMLYVTTLIEGIDEQSRLIRRTIMRYLTLGSILVFQCTSISVKKRFPTAEHLIEAGLITATETKALDEIQTPHGKWWVPFVWCFNLIKDCRADGRITDDFLLKSVMEEILSYRGNLANLYSYDWISIPLVYTQVTTLAVYMYFLGSVLGKQFLDPAQGYPGHDVDLYVPVFTVLQFFFYMGWLKVAEQMINPFGEDDDDFDMNWIIDRNWQVCLMTVDDLYQQYPKLEKDMYFDESAPEFLPYTKSAVSSIKQPFMGSTAQLSVSDAGMKVVNHMETIQEGAVDNTGTVHLPETTSPLSSPGSTRRYHNNLLSVSKPHLGGNKPNHTVSLKQGLNLDPKQITPALKSGNYINYLSSSRLDIIKGMDSARSDIKSPYAASYQNPAAMFQRKVHCPEQLSSPSVSSAINEMCNLKHREGEKAADVESVSIDLTESKIDTQPSLASTIPPKDTSVPTVVIMGSNESVWEFQAPDSNQSTVNSMTPLITQEQAEEQEITKA